MGSWVCVVTNQLNLVILNQPPFYLGGMGEGGVYATTATVCAMAHPQTQELSTIPCFHFYSLN